MANEDKKPTEQPKKAAPAQQHSQSAHAKGPVTGDKCKMEDCKKKQDTFGFCPEHYGMYMSGVIRGDGAKPSDYAEKLNWYQAKNKKAAA